MDAIAVFAADSVQGIVPRALPAEARTLCAESATACGAEGAAPALVVFDAAHNPEGMRAFWASLGRRLSGQDDPATALQTLRERYSLAVVMACSKDRDPCAMVEPAMSAVGGGLERLFFAESDALKTQSPAVLAAAALVSSNSSGLEPAVAARLVPGLALSDAEALAALREAVADEAIAIHVLEAFEAGGVGKMHSQWFRLERTEEEEAAETARAQRVASAAAVRSEAGLAPGARLSLNAERDERWKQREVDGKSGVGVRYARVDAPGDDGISGKGSTAVTAQRSAIHRAFQSAMKHATGTAKADQIPLVVVCGSVYAMREAREAAGIEEPRDSIVK
jgi:hypothetical protein